MEHMEIHGADELAAAFGGDGENRSRPRKPLWIAPGFHGRLRFHGEFRGMA
jgi:hypothetical protein